jgi:hypothetical protein
VGEHGATPALQAACLWYVDGVLYYATEVVAKVTLFEVVHPDVFTVLASPNKDLYASALEVLYEAYQDHLKIPENTLYSMLRGKLERQLAEASFEGEDIDEDELRDISGRARFLMRKLCNRGWFEKERGKDFEENIIVPIYSSKLLELFHQLTSDETMRGYSYVFDTYSSLKVANDGDNAYDKMSSVYSAYDNTQALIKLLKTVYHNVKRYFSLQIEIKSLGAVLSSHFDEFGQKVIEAYIRPLKIRDSVPKYRVPIQSILMEWIEDDAMLLALSNAAFQDRRKETLDACRTDLLSKIFWVKDQYERIEGAYLDEIDQQVRRYTRATTQKIENLTNRDQNTRGNLNYLLTALAENRHADRLLDEIGGVFHLYEQSYLAERSLWYRKRQAKRERTAPATVDAWQLSDETIAGANSLIAYKYSKTAVAAYMRELFAESDVLYSKDIGKHRAIIDNIFAALFCRLCVVKTP